MLVSPSYCLFYYLKQKSTRVDMKLRLLPETVLALTIIRRLSLDMRAEIDVDLHANCLILFSDFNENPSV
jgi:hypothetical protein